MIPNIIAIEKPIQQVIEGVIALHEGIDIFLGA
jgi:hypothetical protein